MSLKDFVDTQAVYGFLMVFIVYYFLRYFVSRIERLISEVIKLSERVATSMEKLEDSLDSLSRQNMAILYINGRNLGLKADDIRELVTLASGDGHEDKKVS